MGNEINIQSGRKLAPSENYNWCDKSMDELSKFRVKILTTAIIAALLSLTVFSLLFSPFLVRVSQQQMI